MTAHRGRLLSETPETGHPVHAASFLRKRQIILDSALQHRQLTRILLHELFHFAWIRLSNAQRESYEQLIAAELQRHARGELGWSAEWRKSGARDGSPRRYREYLCESFCDSGAWRYGSIRKHDEFTLATRWRDRRKQWFDATFPDRIVRI